MKQDKHDCNTTGAGLLCTLISRERRFADAKISLLKENAADIEAVAQIAEWIGGQGHPATPYVNVLDAPPAAGFDYELDYSIVTTVSGERAIRELLAALKKRAIESERDEYGNSTNCEAWKLTAYGKIKIALFCFAPTAPKQQIAERKAA